MSCQGFLQCILKLINFLITLVGAYMIVYSLWMYKEWSSVNPDHHHEEVSSYAPGLLSSGVSALPAGGGMSVLAGEFQNSEAALIVEQLARPLLKEGLKLSDVPAPWFIYAFFCAGAITCFVSLTGHVAAELSNSFCLSCIGPMVDEALGDDDDDDDVSIMSGDFLMDKDGAAMMSEEFSAGLRSYYEGNPSYFGHADIGGGDDENPPDIEEDMWRGDESNKDSDDPYDFEEYLED